MHRSVCAVCLTLAISCAASRGDDAVASETKFLQGTWKVAEMQVKGKKLTREDAEVKNMGFVFKDSTLIVASAAGDGRERKKTFKLDPAKSPKELDLTSHDGVEKGQTAACIYKVEKDRLTLCIPYFTNDPSVRRTEFKSGVDDGLMVLVLERVTPK